jgi:microcystin-dependent protein
MFVACAITVTAQVPYSFNYQGVLRGGSGELLVPPLQRTVDFRLYNSAGSATPLWGRSYTVLLDTNGLFNVELSDSGAALSSGKLVTTPHPLNIVVANNPALYLGLTVNGATEIAPRQQLLSVPYAMMAGDVNSASGEFSVTGALTAKNGVKVLPPSVIEGFGTIPIGGIIMWSGAKTDLPDGWLVCDGTSGTPNLCDKFIVGAGNNYGVGVTGGVVNVTLTTPQIPAHGHDFHDGFFSEVSEAVEYPDGGAEPVPSSKTVIGGHASDHDNTMIYWRPQTTSNTGGGLAHENRPPYYSLYYIIRTK